MTDLRIYCFTLNEYLILNKFPSYIQILGLGKTNFNKNYLDEKKGLNLNSLNHYYGEATGFYWIWKNELKKMNKKSWLGTCNYRKLWLNKCFNNKQKFSVSSLYSNLLQPNNNIFNNSEAVQVQPIIFKKETVLQQFEKVHGKNIITECADFLDGKLKTDFLKFINSNSLSITFFLTTADIFDEYCNILFPWLEKCYRYCNEINVLNGYNARIPAFLMERFNSFWFSTYIKKLNYLSYARLGNTMLSNNINKFVNPMKLPFTLRMYPTLHKY